VGPVTPRKTGQTSGQSEQGRTTNNGELVCSAGEAALTRVGKTVQSTRGGGGTFGTKKRGKTRDPIDQGSAGRVTPRKAKKDCRPMGRRARGNRSPLPAGSVVVKPVPLGGAQACWAGEGPHRQRTGENQPFPSGQQRKLLGMTVSPCTLLMGANTSKKKRSGARGRVSEEEKLNVPL